MKKFKQLTLLVLLLIFSQYMNAQTWTDLAYNQNVTGLELNPMKGLMPGYGISSTMPYSTDHFYITLKEINTARGVYDWTAFENKITSKGTGGRHVVGRVWLFYPGSATGVPQYLINEGVKMYGDCPDWNDAKLNQAILDFIAAYGVKYDGDPRIAMIEAGIYGSWGEWNTVNSPAGVTAMTQQNMDNIIIAYDNAFNKTHIALRYGDKAGTQALARTVGYYDDSFCYETLYTSWCFWPRIVTKGIADIWQTHPISGEMFPQIQDYVFDSWPNPKTGGGRNIEDLETCVRTTHISLSKIGYLYSNIPTATERTNAIRMIKMMGYEYYVRQAKLTPNTDGTVKVEVNLQNKGVAPFYYNWDVEIGAINTSTNQFTTIKTSNWNLTSILPSTSDYYKSVTTNPLPSGSSKIVMRFVNPLEAIKGTAMIMRFANSNQDIDKSGWLTLGTVTAGGVSIPPTSVSVTPPTLTLTAIGQTGQLTATVLPANATDKTVVWSSSNSNIATVNQSGLVTAITEGSVTITATSVNGLIGTSNVTVSISVVLPTSISISPTTLSLTSIGQTGQLTATVLPANATDKTVSWTTNPSGIVTVNSAGLVTAAANGTTTVTGTTVNGLTATCNVTVTIAPPANNVTSLTPWVSGATNNKVAGTNRLMTVMVMGESNANFSATGVTYGGQAMTKQTENMFYVSGNRTYAAIFTLNETGVNAATSGAIAVTWSATPSVGNVIYSVLLGNVDQISPIGATANNGLTGTTNSTSALATSSGNMIIMCGATESNNSITFNNGFTEQFESNSSFGDGTGGSKLATGANETPSFTQSASGRMALCAMVVKNASGGIYYTLTETSPNGRVDFSPVGPTYLAGTLVTVTAVSYSGYNFSSWGGALNGSINPTTILMDDNKAIVANYTAIPGGEALPWNETFTMIDGATTEVAPTSWTATNFRVLANEIAFNNVGADGVFTTGAINIAGNNVRVSVSVRGGSGLDVGQDFLRLYTKVDGGAEVQIAAADGPRAATTWTADITTGSSLVLVLRAHVTATSEYYYFDNLSVTSTGLKSASIQSTIGGNIADNIVNVYPNPVSNTLYVNHSNAQSVTNIKIYNTHGQMLYNRQASGSVTAVDVRELNCKGLIFVKVSSGKDISTFKVSVVR